jgi:hypothetical protein
MRYYFSQLYQTAAKVLVLHSLQSIWNKRIITISSIFFCHCNRKRLFLGLAFCQDTDILKHILIVTLCLSQIFISWHVYILRFIGKLKEGAMQIFEKKESWITGQWESKNLELMTAEMQREGMHADILIVEPLGKRHFALWKTQKYNIRTDLMGLGCYDANCIGMIQFCNQQLDS